MRDSVVLTFLIFCAVLLFYPESSDTKSFTRADEVIFSNGMTVEEARNKTYSNFSVVPDSASYTFKVSTIGYKALISVYVKRTTEVLSVCKYYINEAGIGCFLNYNFWSGVGPNITITPAATADPKVYNFTVTNASGEVVFVERQIIK